MELIKDSMVMYKINKKNKICTGLNKVLLATVLSSASLSVWAQEGILKGRVVDVEGNPIPGAVVNVLEGSRIALSDENGYFQLKKVVPNDEIYATCVGYLPATEVASELDGGFTIVLKEDTDVYMHTAPVPFGRKPMKYMTEATSVVTGEELEKHPVTVLQNAFTSTVTGVETYEKNSEPGWSETLFYIRGLRTMNNNLANDGQIAEKPLVIVDNVERDLSFLDAYPIESITILKDAAACAIYGMRGANGAIIVTTKRGQAGRTKIDFTQEVGFQTVSGIPESQNSYNYALTKNQANYLDGKEPEFSDYDIEMYRRVCNGEQLTGMDRYKYFNTNWHDTMLRDLAPQYRTNLQISGGNARARYYVSFSYLRQEGLYNTEWTDYNEGYSTQHTLNRYNLRSNIDIDVNKFLNVSLDLGGRIDNISQPGIDTWNIFTWGAGENLPINPVFTPNGNWFFPSDSDSKNGAAQIAGRGIEKNRRRNLYTTLTANGDLGSLLPGLKANLTFSFDSYETFRQTQVADIDGYYYNFRDDVSDVSQYTYKRMRTAASLPNPSTSPRDYYYNININGGLSYNHTFNKKHWLDAKAFMRSYQNVVRGQYSSNRYLSYNAQATYVYDSRYIVSGNLSYMGNDNFAPGERYGLFPGGSVGWVLSEEPWFKNKATQLLKIRASYGRAGMSDIYTTSDGVPSVRYPYQGAYTETGGRYNFGTSQSAYTGIYESTVGNRNIKWEISDMVNVGMDFDFWNKKLYGQIDLFKEWRSNILVTRSTIPTGMFGAAVPLDSYGKAETKGFEVTLGHMNKIGDFTYHIQGMLTYNTNKITEMDEVAPDYAYQSKTGNRINQSQLLTWVQWASDPALIPESHQDAIDHPEKYPWHSAGKYQLGNAIFKDTNGDRIIDAYDKEPMGYTKIPELIPTVNIGFEWKGLDARAVLTAYLNRTVGCRENMDYGFGWGGTSTHEVVNTWGYYTDDPTDPRNINAKYPRLSNSFSNIDRNYPYNESTIWVVNGDFLSLRNVEVGYSLPKKWIAKANMTKVRIYFSGYNLCNWSYLPKGFDPENPLNYIWNYPKTKSFTFGINVGF